MVRMRRLTRGSRRRVPEVALEGDGARQVGVARFGWQMEPQDREDIRWYLEDYLQYPIGPAPTIAGRVERRLAELGRELFGKVFESDRDTTRLWDALSDHLPDTRVEVVTTVEDAAAVPWELLRDPATDAVLALRAQAFVRADPLAPQAPVVAETAERVRVLLVIYRPASWSNPARRPPARDQAPRPRDRAAAGPFHTQRTDRASCAARTATLGPPAPSTPRPRASVAPVHDRLRSLTPPTGGRCTFDAPWGHCASALHGGCSGRPRRTAAQPARGDSPASAVTLSKGECRLDDRAARHRPGRVQRQSGRVLDPAPPPRHLPRPVRFDRPAPGTDGGRSGHPGLVASAGPLTAARPVACAYGEQGLGLAPAGGARF